MDINYFSRKYKHFKRLNQILHILGKHGFLEAASLLQGRAPPALARFLPQDSKKPAGVRLREAIEELGPTFVKFGQLLASRRDVLPQEFVIELDKLTDEVPSFPSSEAKEIISRELGGLKRVFKEFDDKPLAAASLGQVHKARLHSGELVVVKIQRPGVQDVVEADLDLLLDVAKFLEDNLPDSRLFQPIALAEQFALTIRREMDYLHEARNAVRFKKLFENDNTIFVPSVFEQYSTKRVLVQEFVEGKKILSCLNYPLAQRKTIVERGATSLLKQVLVHGFFQADPHPGNLLVMKNNVVGIVDYGMMGFLDRESREKAVDFFIALIDKDTSKMADYLLSAGYLPSESDADAFKSDLSEVIEQYYDVELKQMHLTDVLEDLLALIRRFKLRMHPKSMLVLRMLLNLEGLGRRLYPEFNTIIIAKPIVAELVQKRRHPVYVVKQSLNKLATATDALSAIPGQLSKVLSKTESGGLRVNIEHRGLEEPVSELDKTINKVSLSLIVAALIIASALIFAANSGPQLYGYPLLGLIGLAISAFLGLLLVASILASKQF